MAAPWAETPHKVVIEFARTSGGPGQRAIRLTHAPGSPLPPQLQGRVAPEAWEALLQDAQQVAAAHPYVVTPKPGRMLGWLGALVVGWVIGIFVANPDGGDYSTWLPQAEAAVARHQAAFAAGGAALSLRKAQFSYWIQVDVDPSMAVGHPVPQKQ